MKRHNRIGLPEIVTILLIGSGLTPIYADIELPEGYTSLVYANDIYEPRSLAFDSQGYLYVTNDQADKGQIYRISPFDQSVSMFGPFLKDPDSLDIDVRDRVVLGSGDGTIYRIDFNQECTPIESTLLDNVCAITIDRLGQWGQPGTLYVANAQSPRDLLQVNEDDQVEGYLNSEWFDIPYSMTFDHRGNLYVVEGYFSESSTQPGLYRVDADQNIELIASFTAPISLAFDHYLNELYVGDIEDKAIYKVTLDGEVSVFAERLSPYGLAFGPDRCLYVAERNYATHEILKIAGFPQPMKASIDLDPDIIIISTEDSGSQVDSNEIFLTAHIELPRGYLVSDIDANEIALKVQGYALAQAESWITVGDTLQVQCPIDPANLSIILGLEIIDLARSDSGNALKITTHESLDRIPDLISIETCGPFQDAHGFCGTDVIRLRAEDQNEDTD